MFKYDKFDLAGKVAICAAVPPASDISLRAPSPAPAPTWLWLPAA